LRVSSVGRGAAFSAPLRNLAGDSLQGISPLVKLMLASKIEPKTNYESEQAIAAWNCSVYYKTIIFFETNQPFVNASLHSI